jgi:uncharacterized membrane protein
MRARTCRNLIALGGALGLIVSIFAALEFYFASLQATCTVNAFVSCALIAHSGKTTTLGVQDYWWGVAGFVLILALGAISERRRKDDRVTYALFLVTTLGLALSFYWLYVELVEIHGLCPVCVSAYFCGGAAWLGSIGLARRAYRRARTAPEELPAEAPAADPP